MTPKRDHIEFALHLLKETNGAQIIVFHRDKGLNFDGLVCEQTASFPTGSLRLPDEDDTLDSFASFIAGSVPQESELGEQTRAEWRTIFRSEGGKEQSGHLVFSSPEIMITFNHGANKLEQLIAKVPRVEIDKIKNPEARLCRPASMVRPTGIGQVQECVRWALKYGLTLAVLGGSHGGHCIVDNMVSINMAAFDQIEIHRSTDNSGSTRATLVVVGAGCNAGDIVRKTLEAGLTVPLGSRPSVGAGLWLQGGIGHLSRQHGLTCDAIVGAVFVSVKDAQVLVVGEVPEKYSPEGAVRPENEGELLWALKGAGTNFSIVTSVVFEAVPASTFRTTKWVLPLNDNAMTQEKIEAVSKVATGLEGHLSIDMYIYWDDAQLSLGVTLYDAATTSQDLDLETPTILLLRAILGQETTKPEVVNGIQLFDSEMYMSGMHGGHGGGKTSSFKRCVFLKDIGSSETVKSLIKAMESRSSPLCYFHLLQGGGAINNVESDATAFGNRNWDYAVVITGVWDRKEDGTAAARAAVECVYSVVKDLLPFSNGIYGADLGPDPRDAKLAAHAFGLNRPRLARLKWRMDPHNVLAHACPLPKRSLDPKLIVLVTGYHGAGKDYCAAVWTSLLAERSISARMASTSDVTKQEYATSTGASYDKLLNDRGYKEEHRAALTVFYNDQVSKRPDLPQQHFLQVVHEDAGVDVLLITGMRDDAPVATFSHLVPCSRVMEVRVTGRDGHTQTLPGSDTQTSNAEASPSATIWQPDFIFDNNTDGDAEAKSFAREFLLPFFQPDLTRLADMVRSVADFPQSGTDFHHILGIAEQPEGLRLCTSFFQTLFPLHWDKVNTIACCESGGFLFGSALASQLDIPLAVIRKAAKLPPPKFSVTKNSSYISSLADKAQEDEAFEMSQDAVSKNSSVVVVDDVLSSGKTVCAVLQLLQKAGVKPDDVTVMVVAELPIHRGREFLRKRGFGQVGVRSLLVYGGV